MPPDTTGVPVKSPSVKSARHAWERKGTWVTDGPPHTVRLLAESAPYTGHSWAGGGRWPPALARAGGIANAADVPMASAAANALRFDSPQILTATLPQRA